MARSCWEEITFISRVSGVRAVTATGTRSMFSWRRRAVTIIDPSVVESALDACASLGVVVAVDGAGDVRDCAVAAIGSDSNPTTLTVANN
jgi:hypothetical protein